MQELVNKLDLEKYILKKCFKQIDLERVKSIFNSYKEFGDYEFDDSIIGINFLDQLILPLETHHYSVDLDWLFESTAFYLLVSDYNENLNSDEYFSAYYLISEYTYRNRNESYISTFYYDPINIEFSSKIIKGYDHKFICSMLKLLKMYADESLFYLESSPKKYSISSVHCSILILFLSRLVNLNSSKLQTYMEILKLNAEEYYDFHFSEDEVKQWEKVNNLFPDTSFLTSSDMYPYLPKAIIRRRPKKKTRR